MLQAKGVSDSFCRDACVPRILTPCHTLVKVLGLGGRSRFLKNSRTVMGFLDVFCMFCDTQTACPQPILTQNWICQQ